MMETHSQQDPPYRDGSTVILVEDDRELREGIAESLRLNRMVVVEAESGAAFRRAIRSQRADVVILDVNLPDATGFELAREARSLSNRPGIIILTARTGLEDRIDGYREGADLYLTKPVDSVELVLAVRNLANRVNPLRQRSEARARAAGGEWRLDVAASRLVSPQGVAITLSGRETFLLENFAEAAGQPISRERLCEVMGYGAPGPGNRALDAALRRLREKAALAGLTLPLSGVQAIGVRFATPLETEGGFGKARRTEF